MRAISHLPSAICHLLFLVSCAQMKTEVTSYTGGKPIGSHTVTQVLYGKFTTDSGLFDESTMGNLDVGFKYLANMVTALSTAYIAGDVAKAKEITDQLATAGATKVQIANVQAAAAEKAAAAGADLTKFGISNGLFTPAATQFIQPRL